MNSRQIAITIQKGGLGKTTAAVNLRAYLAAWHQKGLPTDADPQARTEDYEKPHP
ncbi:MAG: AAA family ATPase [Halobacteriota archaeon]